MRQRILLSALLLLAASRVQASCDTTKVVKQAGTVGVDCDCNTLQACVDLIPSTLTGNFCIDIQDSASYSEAVTIQGIDPTSAGYEISIGPLNLSNKPVITQPGPVNGPFINVLNSSVTIHDLAATGSGAAVLSVSSANVILSGITVDAEGMALSNGAAVSIGSGTTIIGSSITVNADGGGVPAFGLHITGAGSSISLSTITGSGNQVTDLVELGGSSNTLTQAYVANAYCHGVVIGSDGPSVGYNTVSFSTVTGVGGGCAGLHIAAGSFNLVANSYISNPTGWGALLDTISGANASNSISQSTITSNSASNPAVDLQSAASVSISQSVIFNSSGDGLDITNSGGNVISSCTITSQGSSAVALSLSGSNTNTVSGSALYATGASEGNAFYDLNGSANTVTLSTMGAPGSQSEGYASSGSDSDVVSLSYISAAGAGGYGIDIDGSSNGTISGTTVQAGGGSGDAGAILITASAIALVNDVISASTAVYVSGSTATTIGGSVLTASNPGGAGIYMDTLQGSDLEADSNVIVGGALGQGVFVDQGNFGSLIFSTNTITGSQYGVYVATQAAGAQVWLTSNTIAAAVSSANNTYGLYLDGLTTGATIENNTITYRTLGTMGSYASYAFHALSSSGLLVDHNRFDEPGMITGGSFVAVKFAGTTASSFKFNDVFSTGTALTNAYLLEALFAATSLTVKDNVFSSSFVVSGASATMVVDAASESGFAADYNDYFSSSSSNALAFQWGASAVGSLVGWQANSSQDAHSISANPLWFSPAGGAEDFHPMSTAGRWNPATQTFVSDGAQSLTIDHGDPAEPYANEPAPNGNVVNQGSYGDTAQASESSEGPPAAVALVSVGLSSAAASLSPNAANAYVVQASSAADFSGVLFSSDTTTGTTLLAPQGLNSNTTYYLRVGALWSGATVYSGTILTATTLAPLVTGAQVTAVYASSVTASWTTLPTSPSSSTSEGYDLEASSTNFLAGEIVSSSVTTNVLAASLTVSGLSQLASGVTYYFRVASLNWNGVLDYAAAGSTEIVTGSSQPTSFISAPSAAYLDVLGVISGTAQAYSGAFVSTMNVSVQDLSTNLYWSGSSFVLAAQYYSTAVFSGASSGTWTIPTGGLTLASGTSYQIQSRATDSSGQVQVSVSSVEFTYDTTAPTLSIESPVNGSFLMSFPTLSGTAADPISGVVQAQVQISSSPNYNTCWNGSAWGTCPNLLSAAGTAVWTYTSVPSALVAGSTYVVSAIAIDGATNASSVHVSSFVYANTTGCAVSSTVVAGQNTIQGAVNSIGASLSGNACITVNGGTYNEQVTVQNIATNGFSIIIASGTGGNPVVAAPSASNAAFVIANASVSLTGFYVTPINAMNYGIFVSSPHATLTNIVINDQGGEIAIAGIAASSWTTIGGSTVTVINAHAIEVFGTNASVYSSTATNGGQNYFALYLNGSSAGSYSGLYAYNAYLRTTGPGNTYTVVFATANGNTVSQSTFAAPGGVGAALWLDYSSSNTVTQAIVQSAYNAGANTGAAISAAGSNFNTFSYDVISNDGALGGTFNLGSGSSSNTITHDFISNQYVNGDGVVGLLGPGNDYNTVSFSTLTVNSDFPTTSAPVLINSDYNTVTHNYLSNPSGYAFQIALQYGSPSATGNVVSLNTISNNTPNFPAVDLQNGVSSTLFTQNFISNPSGTAILIAQNADFTTISLSTVTAGFYGLFIEQSSANVVSNDYVAASTAVYIAGSTGTTISGSALAATAATGAALKMGSGSTSLTLSNSALSAPSLGVGISLTTGSNSGLLSFSSNTITGAQYGMAIAAQSPGASLTITSMTFANLTAGATAINFTGGTFVSTFTTVGFDASVGANVNAAALSAGTSITMASPSGARTGPSYSDDPSHDVHWPNIAPPASAVTAPSPGFVNSLPSIAGTAAAFGGAFVSSVAVAVENLGTAQYWNGASFASAAPVYFLATFVGGVTGTWTYASGGLTLASGTSYQIQTQATDSFTQPQIVASTSIFTYDAVPPTVSISSPVNASILTIFPPLAGTAADAISGVTTVRVQISSGPSFGACWTGGAWGACPHLLTAASTAAWTYAAVPSSAFLTSGTNYQVQATAVDGAGNVSGAALISFTYVNGGAGCFVSTTVVHGQNTIQGAVNSAGTTLDGNLCVIVNGGSYGEQVTVQNIATNGFSIIISSGTGGAAIVSPPSASTAAFVINNASVTVRGIVIAPTNPVEYGVLVSSPNALIGGVNVSDSLGMIGVAGISASTWTTVSGASVTVGGAAATGILLPGISYVTVANTSATANTSAGYALWLDAASSNVVVGSVFVNHGSTAAFLMSGANYNTVSLSSFTTQVGDGVGLEFFNASYNTINGVYAADPAGYGAWWDFVTGNVLSQSTFVSDTGLDAALEINNAASNFILSVNAYNPVGPAGSLYIYDFGASSHNTLSSSTFRSNGVGAAALVLGGSFNALSGVVAADASGDGADLYCTNSNVNLSTFTSDFSGAGFSYALWFAAGASSNSIVSSYMSNPAGNAVFMGPVGYNSFSLDTITSNAAAMAALTLSYASHNTISGSAVLNAAGYAAVLDGANNNVLSNDTFASNAPGVDAVELTSASSNTIVGAIATNPAGYGLYLDAGASGNTVSLSTFSVNSANSEAVFLYVTSSNTITQSYLSNPGGEAVYLTLSTATTISSSTIVAGAGNPDVQIDPGNFSGITLAADLLTGGEFGLVVAAQPAGASLFFSSLTFASLTPGATAISFAGGSFVSTFSAIDFADTSIAVNIDAESLTAGSNITMSAPFGILSGPAFSTDPGGYLHWPPGIHPNSFITVPVAAFVNSLPAIDGTAQAFTGAIVTSVTVSVQNLSSGLYWNGAAFASGAQIFAPAAFSPAASLTWAYNSAALVLTSGTSYQIQSQAADSLQQVQTIVSTFVFVLDNTPPAAAIRFPASGVILYSPPTISGTAVDVPGAGGLASGVGGVAVSLEDATTG
ncbi:MAG: right-handed parallel beta-helix repeat-containing protein, partial [Elusimicrobiota bacterium]